MPVLLLYNLFLILYRAAVAVTAIWNPKARAWRNGRKGQWKFLQKKMAVAEGRKRLWMHCASLGEFEQGRPVLEALRTKHSDAFFILSFFSPSGYEQRKDYSGADLVCYLPMDGPIASERFLNIIRPNLALFVKYEFWHYYLKGLHTRGIATMLVSGAFRKKQPFFKSWGGFFRNMLRRFSLLTVQDERSQSLLEGVGLSAKARLIGDTRYDRVAKIAAEAKDLPLIEIFKGASRMIVAGSTWPEDERMLKECMSIVPLDWKLVIAPHEIDAAHLESIQRLFGEDCARYSNFQPASLAKVLVIDNIGMLSSLYRYGEIACVGGGYSKGGIHNVLEPAVFGLPVVMGPEYHKFSEAVAMVKRGFAFAAKDSEAYKSVLHNLISDNEGRAALQGFIRMHVREHAGATAKILAFLPQAF